MKNHLPPRERPRRTPRRLRRTSYRAMPVLAPLLLASAAMAQAPWVTFSEQTCRIDAVTDVLNDAPCDAASCACSPCSTSCPCACACEKDMAVGDLDGNGDDDLIVVRKRPIYEEGGKSNLLFLNYGGVLVDRTDLVEGFEDSTEDRDVVIEDLDKDSQALLDVVTAATNGGLPRIYMNQGCCSTTCSPSVPCAQEDKVDCAPGVNWCGLKYDASRMNAFSCVDGLGNPVPCPGPKFCGVAAGDVNGDGCPDLYFVDYDNNLDDRLMINQKPAGVCTATFVDETAARLTADMRQSDFGTGAQILDVNRDGLNDIVKSEDAVLEVFYNDPANPGNFTLLQDLDVDVVYMFAAGDVNGDLRPDVYAITDLEDEYLINDCLDPPDCNNADGSAAFIQSTVTGSYRTHVCGGNAHLADLDGDTFDDVLVSDVDVKFADFTGQLAVLQTQVNPLDVHDVTITDPLNSENNPWNTLGTYDAIAFRINAGPDLDIWSGTGGGNQIFIQGSGVIEDCNANGTEDACDIASQQSPDCNKNGIPDLCDIMNGTSDDCDADGVPDDDVCQPGVQLIALIARDPTGSNPGSS